jgi:hypothetical protein
VAILKAVLDLLAAQDQKARIPVNYFAPRMSGLRLFKSV